MQPFILVIQRAFSSEKHFTIIASYSSFTKFTFNYLSWPCHQTCLFECSLVFKTFPQCSHLDQFAGPCYEITCLSVWFLVLKHFPQRFKVPFIFMLPINMVTKRAYFYFFTNFTFDWYFGSSHTKCYSILLLNTYSQTSHLIFF